MSKDTTKSVELINNTPYIECDVHLTANVLTLDDTIDLSKKEAYLMLAEYANLYLEECISEYLYKTAKEFKSDITGFGNYAIVKYSTWEDWIDSDWLNNYQNSFFNVNVDVTIASGYLFTKF